MIARLAIGAVAALGFAAGASAQDAHDHAGHDHDHTPPAPKGEAPSHVFTEAPEDHAVGAEDAPHTLIVYASNTCPHCRSWFTEEYPVVKSELIDTGKLRLVYRPIPTAPAQLSMIGFMIASCAGEDADYLDNILYQYERQSIIFEKAQTGGLQEEYRGIARRAGLADDAAMDTCLRTQDNLDAIHLAGRRANHGRVAGIPSFVFDGEGVGTKETAASLAKRVDN